MALSTILKMEDDVQPFFGVSCEDNSNDAILLRKLRQWTENQARRFVRWGITTATYTNEYHRRDDIGAGELTDQLQVQGNNVYLQSRGTLDGHILQLDNLYVTSVSDVREDSSAYFGQGGSDFAVGTALTAGTHYVLESDDDTFCKSGRLVRINRGWSSRPGTLRVTYIAGFTAAQLNDEYSFVKEALLEEMQLKFSRVRTQRTNGGGPLRKETYFGDVSREYAVATGGSVSSLSSGTMSKLSTIRKLSP